MSRTGKPFATGVELTLLVTSGGLDMRKIVIAGFGLLALATALQPAAAADMPVKAPYKAPRVPVWTWDGWYFGEQCRLQLGALGQHQPVQQQFPRSRRRNRRGVHQCRQSQRQRRDWRAP